MRISRSADFALRLLIYLASEKKTTTMPILAERLGIPYNNLSKLIQALSKAQLVQTRQGKNGGVQLLREPMEISMKAVLDVIDGPVRLSDCLIPSNSDICLLNGHCKLKTTFSHLQHDIDSLFESVKIAQMV